VVLDNTVALHGNNFTRGNVYKTPRVGMATTTHVAMAETPRVAMAKTPCVAMAKTPRVAMAKTPRMAMSWRGNHVWQWPVPRACFTLGMRKIAWCHAKKMPRVCEVINEQYCIKRLGCGTLLAKIECLSSAVSSPG